MGIKSKYIEKLKKRAKESRVYKKYQLIGLEIAQALGDEKHKSLYIKLAKEGNAEKLLRLAKEIGERKGVRNKGAYFMSTLTRTTTHSHASAGTAKIRNDTKVRKNGG